MIDCRTVRDEAARTSRNELCDWLIDKFGFLSSFGVCLQENNTYILYKKDAVAFFHDKFGHLVCWSFVLEDLEGCGFSLSLSLSL